MSAIGIEQYNFRSSIPVYDGAEGSRDSDAGSDDEDMSWLEVSSRLEKARSSFKWHGDDGLWKSVGRDNLGVVILTKL